MDRDDIDQGGILITDGKLVNPFWRFRQVLLFVPRIIFYLFIAPWNYMAITNPPGGRNNRGENYRIGLTIYFTSAVVLRFWGANNTLIAIALLTLVMVAFTCRLAMLWQSKLNFRHTWKEMFKLISIYNLMDSNQSVYLTKRRSFEESEA